MTTTSVRRLAEVRMADVAEVGGKAAGLGELLALGARVPHGVVLTAGAAGMTADERQTLLRDAANDLGTGVFAVRSSGIAEDGVDRSYAGIYETELDVGADQVAGATDRVLSSVNAARAAEYGPAGVGRMAVIIQHMVQPVAAGVVLTADPINGDRDACVVTAVRGTGDRLVSGAAVGDEWVVRDDDAVARRQPEQAIDRRQATEVASEARRIAAVRGSPQDIEWAFDADGTLWILQARPMTAVPPDVSWEAPGPGAYSRALRFGEWISEPVTPLFESWLLSSMEVRLHRRLREWIGQGAPLPHHVVVNGWYFYSLNWIAPGNMARSLPRILWKLIRSPRRVVGVINPLVRYSYPLYERDWREELLPRYRAAVARADSAVETVPVSELPALIDELADVAGDYFASIAAFAGSAYKMEMNLAQFYRRHLAESLGGSHLPLVAGFEPPADPGRHAVASLDWHAPLPSARTATRPAEDHARLVEARQAAETAAFQALASSPRRLRAFRRLLAEAQHLVPVREEHVRELTIAWPAMRRAVLRIGEALAAGGAIAQPDDVFFLTRAEAMAALAGEDSTAAVDVAGRRSQREEQSRLVAPLLVGRLNRFLQTFWDNYPRTVGAARSDTALVSGTPASPGRATGPVRVIRGPDEFDQLQPGEILVAPLTAPAWTPLFTRA
ncbi:MAG: PEP/pyruvate-binding domain-containing protein, partial [Chloroflexota bacterium]